MQTKIKCWCGEGAESGLYDPRTTSSEWRGKRRGQSVEERLPDPSLRLQVGTVPGRNQVNHIFRNPRMYWYFFFPITWSVTFVDHKFIPKSALWHYGNEILSITFPSLLYSLSLAKVFVWERERGDSTVSCRGGGERVMVMVGMVREVSKGGEQWGWWGNGVAEGVEVVND